MAPTTKRTTCSRRRWLGVALAVCIAAPALLVLPGCCSTFCKGWCARRCVSHVETFAIQQCGNECVFYMPKQLRHLKHGQVVHFVNASPYRVNFEAQAPGDAQVFEGVSNNKFSLSAGETKSLTVAASAPVEPGLVFPTVVTVVSPGQTCPGYPGPGMEVDN